LNKRERAVTKSQRMQAEAGDLAAHAGHPNRMNRSAGHEPSKAPLVRGLGDKACRTVEQSGRSGEEGRGRQSGDRGDEHQRQPSASVVVIVAVAFVTTLRPYRKFLPEIPAGNPCWLNE
jgi:hypothetical protein